MTLWYKVLVDGRISRADSRARRREPALHSQRDGARQRVHRRARLGRHADGRDGCRDRHHLGTARRHGSLADGLVGRRRGGRGDRARYHVDQGAAVRDAAVVGRAGSSLRARVRAAARRRRGAHARLRDDGSGGEAAGVLAAVVRNSSGHRRSVLRSDRADHGVVLHGARGGRIRRRPRRGDIGCSPPASAACKSDLDG